MTDRRESHGELKRAFENGPSVFQTLAAQRTHRVFKGFSKDITRPEVHAGTGRTLEMQSAYMQPSRTALTWEGDDRAEVEPITELETALILWAACGPNGIVAGDIGVNENLSTMVCMAGRTVPGPCNDAAVHIVFANDEGTFLYKPSFERERPVEIESEEDYDKVLRWFREGTVKLSDRRPDIDWSINPGRPAGIYQVNTNKPGSTVFYPVYGTAHEMINYLFAGFEWLGWYFVDEETDEPAGCARWVEDPKYHLEMAFTLRQYEQFMTITEANPPAMAIQNIRLAAESLGLGSWNHSTNMDLVLGGMNAVYDAMGRKAGEFTESRGLGFTYTTAHGTNNYVGIPGVLEGMGLPAPWNEGPEAVVRHVAEDKYRKGKFMSDGTEFFPVERGPWRPEVLDAIRRHPRIEIPDWVVEASTSVVRYCFEKFGRYPVYFSDFQNSMFMIEVGVVDDRFYDEKNVAGFVNPRIRKRSSRRRRVRRAA